MTSENSTRRRCVQFENFGGAVFDGELGLPDWVYPGAACLKVAFMEAYNRLAVRAFVGF